MPNIANLPPANDPLTGEETVVASQGGVAVRIDVDQIAARATGGSGGGAVSSVAGRTGAVTLAKSDVGLANVDNTADAAKPVSTAQAAAISSAVAGKADASAVTAALATKADASALAAKADAATVTAALATKADKLDPVTVASGATLNRADHFGRLIMCPGGALSANTTGQTAGDLIGLLNTSTSNSLVATIGTLTLTIPAGQEGQASYNGTAWINASVPAYQPATITGTPGVGNLLTATLPAGVSAALKNWTRNGADISGATNLTYTQVMADASTTVGFWYVPAISGSGVAVPASSLTVPDAPTGLTLGSATSSSQPLTWAAPANNGGAALISYRVGYRIAGSGSAYSYLSTGSTTTGYVVPGLTASTSYEYVVDAVNAVGAGADSSAVTGSTASASVQQLRFASRSSRQATGSNASPAGRLHNVSRQPIWIGSGDRSDLVLSFPNWWTTATAVVLGTNAFTVTEAWLEKGDGSAKTQLKFGGANSTTVAAGATDIKTDAVLPSAFGLSKFSRDEKYWLRLVLSVTTAGHVLPQMGTYVDAGYPAAAAVWVDPTENATMYGAVGSGLGAITISGAYTNSLPLYSPTVLGRFVTGDPATFLGVGDSINDGSADTKSGTMSNGWFQRALASNDAGTTDVIAAMKIAQGSSTAALWNHANAGVMEAYLKYAKYLVDAYGTNYFQNANTTGTDNTAAKAGVQAIWTKAAAQGVVGVVRTKLVPRTLDGDFTTTGAQTYLNTAWGVGGDARAFNTWVDGLSGVSPVVGIIPFTSARDGTDPYKWPVTGAADYATADGVHPSTVIHAAMGGEARAVMTSLA